MTCNTRAMKTAVKTYKRISLSEKELRQILYMIERIDPLKVEVLDIDIQTKVRKALLKIIYSKGMCFPFTI